MIYEDIVLQDFTSEAWKKINRDGVPEALVKFMMKQEEERVGELGYTVGETLSMIQTRVSHTILTARLENDKIMGSVMFHRSKQGKEAVELYEMGKYKFTVRALAKDNVISGIITFDLVSKTPTTIKLID